MRWAFWRKEPDPPPRPMTRRLVRKEPPSAPQQPAEPPPEALEEMAPAEAAPPPQPDPGTMPAAAPTPSSGVPALGRSTERLGDLLVKSGAISQDALEKALDTQRELRADTYLGEILVRENIIDEEKLAGMISQQYRIPLLRMDGHEFKKDLLGLLTAEDAWRLRAIPTDKLGRILSVGMTNPLDERAIAELGKITGLKIKPLIVVGSEMRRALDFVYPGRAPSTVPRPRTSPPAAKPTPGTGRTGQGPATGKFVALAPDPGTKAPPLAPGANTILRRAPAKHVAPAPAVAAVDRLVAESVTEDAFEAATSTNPEHLLRSTPEGAQRRRALPATPIGDAEFVLFVGSLPRVKT